MNLFLVGGYGIGEIIQSILSVLFILFVLFVSSLPSFNVTMIVTFQRFHVPTTQQIGAMKGI